MRIFYAVEHHNQRIFPALGFHHVLEPAVLLGRGDSHHALVRRITGHAIKFRSLQEAHRNAQLAALFYDALQAQVVTLLRQADPLERTSLRLDRFAHRVEAVDVVHRMVSVPPGRARRRAQGRGLSVWGLSSYIAVRILGWYRGASRLAAWQSLARGSPLGLKC